MTKTMIPAWIEGILTPVEKLEVHKRGLKHPAISVFLFCNTKTLIQKRAANKYHCANQWANACCSHPHWGETSIDAAQRRLTQELNINIPTSNLKAHGNIEYRANVGNGLTEHEVADIFIANLPFPSQITPTPSEVQDTKWVEIDHLIKDMQKTPHEFTPWLHIYIKHHLDQILGH